MNNLRYANSVKVKRLNTTLTRKAFLDIRAKFSSTVSEEIGIFEKSTNRRHTGRLKSVDEIPGPRAWPVFGSLLQYRLGPYSVARYADSLVDLNQKYGPVVKVSRGLGREPVIHVFDPDSAQKIYDADGKLPHAPPLQDTAQLYRKMRKISLGLGNTNGKEWYKFRNAAHKVMLQPKVVQQYLPLVNNIATDLVQVIRDNLNEEDEVPKFKNLATRWNLESAGLIVFGRRLGVLKENSEWADAMMNANSTVFKLAGSLKFCLPFYKYFSTPRWRQFVKAEDFYYGEAKKLIDSSIAKIQNRSLGEKKSVMQDLLLLPELSLSDASIIAYSLMEDGLNTTSATLIYNLYCLAKNPLVQRKVLNEIKSHVTDLNQPITVDILNGLSYLKACIKETFRMFPNGTEVSRILQKDLVLSGYKLPAQTTVDINMGPNLRRPDMFPNPDKYIPERWLRTSSEYLGNKIHPFILTPFSHGPRMCPGRRFAEQDLQVALSKLILNYEVGFKYGELGQKMETLLIPDGSCQFTFSKRS